MDSNEIKKKLTERQNLAEKAYVAYQQLEGQIALLRDMLKDRLEEEKPKQAEVVEPKEK